jgi:DNA-binding NarL/FixJ family response regulator
MTLRCVIVDDSRDVLRAAREFLEKEGVAVVGVATTSEEAVSLVLERQPDVALVDILLGLESGFDLIRRLAQEDDVGCRAILISTHDEADFADLIAASPAIGFLPKSELSAAAIQRLLTAAHTDRDD